MKHTLVLVSVLILVLGNLGLWFLSFSFFGWLGFGFLSFGLLLLLTSVFLLPYVFIFRYAVGKPIRRWQAEVVQGYVGMAILIMLGFAYDVLLPGIFFIWRWAILPLLTMITAFYLLQRIPKVREKLDKLRDES